MVKIIKTAFTKTKYSGKDPQLALLALHRTPVDSHPPSPAQLLFHWRLKTRLSTQPSNIDLHVDEHHEHMEDKADHAKMTHDQKACTLLPLFGGQIVSILDFMDSGALTVTQIIPSIHHCVSSVPPKN